MDVYTHVGADHMTDSKQNKYLRDKLQEFIRIWEMLLLLQRVA